MDERMAKQTIITPNGERLVVLPEAEYDALLDAAEDAADAVVVEAHLERAARGDEDPVPVDVLKRLLDPAESRVRVWREHRGLTAAQLSRRAGLSGAYLSQIESGARSPSVKSLKALAGALQVDLDDLA